MPPSEITPSTSQTSSSQNPTQTVSLSGITNATRSGVLLSTALVNVRDRFGNYHQLRALLDSGSQVSIITEKCYRRLNLPSFRPPFSIRGLGQAVPLHNAGAVTLHLKPVGKESPIFMFDALFLQKICDTLPSSPLPKTISSHTRGLTLADPEFYCPGEIDLLLGADLYPQIVLDGNVAGQFGDPVAVNTIFGYVLLGKIDLSPPTSVSTFFITTTEENCLESSITKFWEIENVPDVHSISDEDRLCEQHFVDSCKRDNDGRFTVSLPFRKLSPVFPEIRSLAMNRFLSLERRLLKEPNLYEEYCKFLQEYLNLGHMKLVTESHLPDYHYYIPHHCVIKPSSSSTKLRVVFNASARLPNQQSLNDCLYIGPKLQNDILTILLNFRFHKVCFTADIRQMYRQILISSQDQDYQRIIWRFSPSEPIQDFKLRTVTYG